MEDDLGKCVVRPKDFHITSSNRALATGVRKSTPHNYGSCGAVYVGFTVPVW